MRACIALLLLLGAWLLACASDTPPPLIQVTDFAPREVEVGDRIEVTGAGFPQGRSARVVLRGALHRAGEAPERIELPIEGVVTNNRQIEIAYGESLETQLCKRGLGRVHTTFRGDVEVSFPAVVVGAPPVSALLRGVTLDFRPPVAVGDLDEAVAAGNRTLSFLGLAVSEPGGGAGLLVERVEPGSRAERAGIGVGDRLVSFDGLRITSRADLLPKPGRTATLGVRRADEAGEITREIAIDGLSTAPGDDLVASLAIALVAVALLLAFFAPAEGSWTHLERRAALSLRAAEWLRRPPPAALVAASLWSLVFVLLPAARFLVSADLDVPILLVCAVTSAAAAALGRGGFGPGRALTMLSHEALAALAIASVVVATGSLRLCDVVRAQGALPWEWQAFRDPASLVLFVLFGIGAVAGAMPEDRSAARPSWLAAAEASNAFVRAGLAAALFLGGWQLPMGWREGAIAGSVLAGLVFLAKTCILVAVGVVARASLAGTGLLLGRGFCWKRLVPAALAALAACVAWTAWSPTESTQAGVGAALFGLFATALLRGVHRLRFFWRAAPRDGTLDMYA
jgi:NADH-quinone oxidoreductase subunit H